MPTIDYALAYDLVDPDKPANAYRLEFRYAYRPAEDPIGPGSNPVGQLVATVKSRSPNGGTRIPISRSGVHSNAVEAASTENTGRSTRKATSEVPSLMWT